MDSFFLQHVSFLVLVAVGEYGVSFFISRKNALLCYGSCNIKPVVKLASFLLK